MIKTPDLFEKLLDAIAQPVAVTDRQHRLVLINEAYSTLIRRPREELLGKTCHEYLPRIQAARAREVDERVFETGQANLQEEELTDEKGSFHTLRIHRIPYTGSEGEQLLITVLEYVTSLREIQAVISKSDQFSAMLNSVDGAIIAADTLGTVVYMNRAAEILTGWEAEEARGLPLSETLRFLEALTKQPLAEVIKRLLASSANVNFSEHLVLLALDGTQKAVQGSSAIIRTREGKELGAVLLLRDITQSKKAGDSLGAAERIEAVGKFAGSIAHELGNLVTGIGGFIELAGFYTAQENTKAVGNLGRAAAVLKRAKNLAMRLQTFSRGGAPIMRPTSPADLVRQYVDTALGGYKVKCELIVADGLWLCDLDENQMGLALTNILSNARQATTANSAIIIRVRNVVLDSGRRIPLPEGRYVALDISDSGPGISPEVAERIFEPFFTTRDRGCGLGLTVADSIVKNHHGHIDVTSAPGEGTTFTIYLPAGVHPNVGEGANDSAQVAAARRILVMDHDEVVRLTIARLLSQLGYSVETACDAGEVVTRYRTARLAGKPFEAVVLDIAAEDGGCGIEALAQLRTLDPNVRAIAMSGYANDPVIANPRNSGFDAALRKPHSPSDLEAVLKSTLDEPPDRKA